MSTTAETTSLRPYLLSIKILPFFFFESLNITRLKTAFLCLIGFRVNFGDGILEYSLVRMMKCREVSRVTEFTFEIVSFKIVASENRGRWEKKS